MKHKNIPIFIPHLGCPHTCIFCNQRTISGCRSFDRTAVKGEIETALETISGDDDVEIAFFGGSFTGIDRNDMIYLLDVAQSYINEGRVSSIRLSTRPDYIDSEILGILSRYSVRHIELGIQCIEQSVLDKNQRGHTSQCSIDAMKAVVSAGFELTGQMMIGLYGATADDELATAEAIIACGANSARIYPTAVLDGTVLADKADSGEYRTLTLDELVMRSASVFERFVQSDVDVIRIGLCASDGLEGDIHCGEYHPAMGELVIGEYYYRLICKKLDEIGFKSDILKIKCPAGSTSEIIGQRGCNRRRICEHYGIKTFIPVENDTIKEYNINICD